MNDLFPPHQGKARNLRLQRSKTILPHEVYCTFNRHPKGGVLHPSFIVLHPSFIVMKRSSKKKEYQIRPHDRIVLVGEEFLNSPRWSCFSITNLLLSPFAALCLVLVVLFSQAYAVRGESFPNDVSDACASPPMVKAAVASLISTLLIDMLRQCCGRSIGYKGRVAGSKTRRRIRSPIHAIFKKYGPREFRRAFRMDEESFWHLLDLLEPRMAVKRKRKRGATPNGSVANSTRLAMALRYFAGGDPIDIAIIFMVTPALVYNSVWLVVEAIHKTKSLEIKYPSQHAQQLLIAKEFEAKSRAHFNNCAGCIDGILIWINKPSERDLKNLGIGGKKFFCGRKKKLACKLFAMHADDSLTSTFDIRELHQIICLLLFHLFIISWKEKILTIDWNHFCSQDLLYMLTTRMLIRHIW